MLPPGARGSGSQEVLTQSRTGRWEGKAPEVWQRQAVWTGQWGLSGSAQSGGHAAPTLTLKPGPLTVSSYVHGPLCSLTSSPPHLVVQEHTGRGRGPPEMTPAAPWTVCMKEAREARQVAEGEDRECRLFWHQTQPSHRVMGASDSQMGTPTLQVGRLIQGQERHVCEGVQQPEHCPLIFRTFHLRHELEVLAGTSPSPGPHLPSCLLPRWARGSRTRGSCVTAEGAVGGGSPIRTQASSASWPAISPYSAVQVHWEM